MAQDRNKNQAVRPFDRKGAAGMTGASLYVPQTPDGKFRGRILCGVGGLYTVLPDGNDTDKTVLCRARGSFRHAGETPLVGDTVLCCAGASADCPCSIDEIVDRRVGLIRPPMANIDYLLVTIAAACPDPIIETVDSLLCIAEHNEIEPVVLLTKCELDAARTQTLADTYRRAGFTVFTLSGMNGDEPAGLAEVDAYIAEILPGHVIAFAGASGVGKSTLLGRLFPDLHPETGEVSQKAERGKQTTRRVELFPRETQKGIGFIADTPGFSLLDFVHFDFFKKEDLPFAMRDFRPYLGSCRYTDCTHTKEEDCAVVQAVRRGEIAKTRHDSFLYIYNALKDKHDWD